MAEPRRADADVMLQVKGLNVYYGRSHALQGVDLTLEHGVLSVVGRNGMGKTTLCKTIMGLARASSGSIRVRGEEMLGLPPAQIARHGVGYVPQGRSLWRSLTVDEHLRMIAARQSGAWTVERVYDAFPRLAERKNNGGGQLSGGEQQMLAISRALVTNPHLLIMDEPTEGLAPVIVSQVEEMLVRLGEESDIAILVIEQNIGVATSVSENVAIMVNGRINRIIELRRLAADRDLQQRLLGRRPPLRRRAGPRGRDRARSRGRSAERRKAGGGADQDLRLQPDAADAVVAAGPQRANRGERPDRLGRPDADRGGRRAASGGAARRATGGPRGRDARHQGNGTALHPRPHRRERPADPPGRRLDERQARDLRRDGAGDRAQPWPRRRGRVRPRARRFGRRDGRSVRSLDPAPERHRRDHQRGRLGRRLDRRAGHARSADRHAEGADLLDRLRRRRPLRRPDATSR